MNRSKYVVFSIFVWGLSIGTNIKAQDTIVYEGILHNIFLLETFELYPDSTFKWTSEYDLTWSEFGIYKSNGANLILEHYLAFDLPLTKSLRDTINQLKTPSKTKQFEVSGNRTFPLSPRGRRITSIKNSFFRRKWSWLFGNRYRYKIIQKN